MPDSLCTRPSLPVMHAQNLIWNLWYQRHQIFSKYSILACDIENTLKWFNRLLWRLLSKMFRHYGMHSTGYGKMLNTCSCTLALKMHVLIVMIVKRLDGSTVKRQLIDNFNGAWGFKTHIGLHSWKKCQILTYVGFQNRMAQAKACV